MARPNKIESKAGNETTGGESRAKGIDITP